MNNQKTNDQDQGPGAMRFFKAKMQDWLLRLVMLVALAMTGLVSLGVGQGLMTMQAWGRKAKALFFQLALVVVTALAAMPVQFANAETVSTTYTFAGVNAQVISPNYILGAHIRNGVENGICDWQHWQSGYGDIGGAAYTSPIGGFGDLSIYPSQLCPLIVEPIPGYSFSFNSFSLAVWQPASTLPDTLQVIRWGYVGQPPLFEDTLGVVDGNAPYEDAAGTITVPGGNAHLEFFPNTGQSYDPFYLEYWGTREHQWDLGMGNFTIVTRTDVTIEQEFNPATVFNGQTSTYTLTLSTLPDATVAPSGINMLLTLPSGVTVVAPAVSSQCGGTVSTSIGGNTLGLTGGSLGVFPSTCTIVVLVTAPPGVYSVNTNNLAHNTNNSMSSFWTFDETLFGTATLTVLAAPPPSATITGRVFDDANSNGVDDGDTGIAGAWLLLEGPTAGTFAKVQSDTNGDYSFGVSTLGTYTIYETVVDPGDVNTITAPPATFTQPVDEGIGAQNTSTTPRQRSVTVTQANIDDEAEVPGGDFGHDTVGTQALCSGGSGFGANAVFISGTKRLQSLNLSSGVTTDVDASTTNPYPSLGLSKVDGYLYSMAPLSGANLMRIDPTTGSAVTMPLPVPLLTYNATATRYEVGAVNADGYLFIKRTANFGGATTNNNSHVFIIDVNPNRATYLQRMEPDGAGGYVIDSTPANPSTFLRLPGGALHTPGLGDWVFGADGLLYGAQAAAGNFIRYNPAAATSGSMVVEILKPGGFMPTGNVWGRIYADAANNFYLQSDGTGSIYKVYHNGTDWVRSFVGPGPTVAVLSDSASQAECLFISPLVDVEKTTIIGAGTFTFSGNNLESGRDTTTLTTTVAGTAVETDDEDAVTTNDPMLVASVGADADIFEDVPPGWKLSEASCKVDGAAAGSVVDGSGAAVTLPFANTTASPVQIGVRLPASNFTSGNAVVCSFENEPDVPRVTIIKVTEGGVGTFVFNGTAANDNGFPTDESYEVVAATAGTPASGTTVFLGAANVLTEIVETQELGWTLTSARCEDLNAVSTGNPTGPVIGAVTDGMTLVIPAGNALPGADLQCTFTNTYAGLMLTGQVLVDNGLDAGAGGIAHDAIQNGVEAGLGGVDISLTDCGTTILGSTTTAGDGTFSLPLIGAEPITDTFNGDTVCVVRGAASGHIGVSGNPGDTTRTLGAPGDIATPGYDVLTFEYFADTGYSGVVFGVVARPILVIDTSAAAVPGGVVLLAHKYTATTSADVSFALVNATGSPDLAAFAYTLFRDDDCSGMLETGEAAVAGAIGVVAADEVCLIVRVQASAAVAPGSTLIYDLTATTDISATTSAVLALLSNHDIVTVTAGGTITLVKQVRNCGATGASCGSYAVSSAGAPGDVLEYRITFTNPSSEAVANVSVFDETPAYTSLAVPTGASVSVAPAGMSCAVSVPGTQADGYVGTLQWDCTSSMLPGDSGAVLFRVRIAD